MNCYWISKTLKLGWWINNSFLVQIRCMFDDLSIALLWSIPIIILSYLSYLTIVFINNIFTSILYDVVIFHLCFFSVTNAPSLYKLRGLLSCWINFSLLTVLLYAWFKFLRHINKRLQLFWIESLFRIRLLFVSIP